MIEATKFYVRYREDLPETVLQDYSRRGFWSMGVETVPFYCFSDIDNMEDLGPTVGLSGYIGDVHKALGKAGKTLPPNVDYPQPLLHLLGRDIKQTTLSEVRSSSVPVFVKPVEHKLFTGFVWHNDVGSRMKILTLSDETEVFTSPALEIVSEYRSFVLDNKILDVRRYAGSWSDCPNRNIVEDAVRLMKNDSPRAYCLDWFMTRYGQTILGEMNEGYAFGHYGLQPEMYAKMLSARWSEFWTK